MSGIGHAIKKVFKTAGKIIKKVWKPLVIAAAIYFTGGMALGALGAMSAGGSVLAGAEAGLSAAAGGIGIGAGAGIGGAFAAGAGTAAGLGAAGAAGALGAGALAAGGAEASPWLAGSVLADAGAGAGLAGAEGAGMMGGVGMLSSLGGDAAGAAYGGLETAGGEGLSSAVDNPGAYTYAGPEMSGPPAAGAENPYTYGDFTTNEPTAAMGPPSPGDPSPMWSKALGLAKDVMTTPGMPSLIGGLLQSYNQGKMLDAQMKWADERAPGQIAGGTKNAWAGMPNSNPNLAASTTTPMPGAGVQQLPLNPIPITQVQPGELPGADQPGGNAANYPGYGMPGYGQQAPVAAQPPQWPPKPQGGLMQTPFIDSPYDQNYG